MKIAITKAALTIGGVLTSGSLAYATHANSDVAIVFVALTALIFGFLAFIAEATT